MLLRRIPLSFGLILLLLSGRALLAQSDFEVTEASLVEIQAALESGHTNSVQLLRQYLDRIEAYDRSGPRLNSIIRINEAALDDAARLDAERQAGQLRGPLHGIPIVVKDNYNTVFMPTTGGSVALADFVPTRNAHQVDLLIEAGAIILAKTNLHEYAYGITTVSSLGGQTRNPYDLRRVPGGSSGGTAAAVAASLAAAGLGSDTCGSIRIPAAYNNLFGLRISKGLSSIYGVMPLSHTQDVAGPLARSSEDLAILLDALSGYDARDSATEPMQELDVPAFREQLGSVDPGSLRLGRLGSYLETANGLLRSEIDAALDWFAAQGAEVIDLEFPELGRLLSGSGVIGHEFATDINQYLSLFVSDEVANLNDIVDLGLYHEAVGGALRRSQASVFNPGAYEAALQARQELRRAIEALMSEHQLDAIVYPPIAELPVMIGNSQPGNNCALSANSGLPALSMPLGFTESGLPLAMELLGPFMSDAKLLAIGHAWEQAQSPRQRPFVTPPLEAGRAPQAIVTEFEFRAGQVQLQADFRFEQNSNLLHYSIAEGAQNAAQVHAVTLVIDEEAGFELNDPVIVNLMGPQQDASSGSYFMSPAFRQAFLDRRVYMKVFASGLFSRGVAQNIRP
ncbi:MAG: amidase [Pseudomonadales bacterium]|nr:amidase [Pseudomonadales bacterium]